MRYVLGSRASIGGVLGSGRGGAAAAAWYLAGGVSAALTAYDAATGADVAAISVPSAATIADAVWDEALAGHTTAGSAGALLTASGAASDPLLNLVPGSYASGTAGYYLGRLANSQVDLVSVFDPVTKTLSYYYGDDYTSDESRQQTFTTELDLSGNASVVWIVGTSSGVKSINCAIVDAHTYSLEVTAENLTQIGVGIWPYDFEITLDNGHTVTEITGQVLVSADVR